MSSKLLRRICAGNRLSIVSWSVAAALILLGMTGQSTAAESTLTDKEAPLLLESNFAGVVKKENCIVMYYSSDVTDRDEAVRSRYGMTPIQIGDALMRALIAFRDRTTAPVKFYRVNWKDFSSDSLQTISFHAASVFKRPESPSIVAYSAGGKVFTQFRGITRPDTLAWLINDLMDDYVSSIKSAKDEYLYAGWAVTDTNAKFVNLADMKKETMEINGKPETVQVTSYRSQEFEEVSCSYDRVFAQGNRLIGSIESCGKFGRIGYFDYDRTGKLQYRVKFRQEPVQP